MDDESAASAGTRRSEAGPRILSVAAFVLLLLAITVPRATTTALMLPIVLVIGLALATRRLQALRVDISAPLVAITAFGVWSILSALWSADPIASATKPLYILGGAAGLALLGAILTETRRDLLVPIAYGVLIGFAIGATFQAIETVSNQAITRAVYNIAPFTRAGQEKHIVLTDGMVTAISETNINRRAAIVTLLSLPMALLAVGVLQGAVRRLALGGLAVLAAITLIASGHQSSQLAILLGAAALALAVVTRTWALRLVAVAWIAATLLIVPIALGLHAAGLHNPDSGVFRTARMRIVIWHHTAEKVMAAPVLGVGADATPNTKAGELMHDEFVGADGDRFRKGARHAHNAYLQVWYELGAVGALLFAALGVAVVTAIGRANLMAQPFLLAQMATTAGMIASSYSIWQLWFQAAIGLGLLGLLLATALLPRTSPATQGG